MGGTSSKSYQAAYYLAHRAERAARNAAYRAAHREQARAYDAAYRAGHADERKRVEYHAAYRAAHRKEVSARSGAWHAAHPEANRRQYARRQGAPECAHAGCRTLGASRLAWITSEHVCWMCRVPVWEGINLHMDHVVPIARGGIHCAENIRPACASCNLRKGAHQAIA